MALPALDEFRAAFLRNVDAFNRRDWDSIIAGLPERFEWHFLEDAVDRRATSPGDLEGVFADLVGQFPDWHVEPVEIVEAARGVFVVRMIGTGTGAASGAPIQLDFTQAWEYEGDQAVRCREFSSFADALVAVRQ